MSYPCAECGYELEGNTSGICPECGATIPEEMRDKILSGKRDHEPTKSAAELLRQVRAVMQDRTRLAAFLKRADVLVTLIVLLLFVVSMFGAVGLSHWTSSYAFWGIECGDGCVRVGWDCGVLFSESSLYARQLSGDRTFGLSWVDLCHDSAYYKDVYRVPLWLIWLMLMIAIYLWRRANTPGRLDCVKCGCDLTGNTSSVCPECGTKIADGIRQEIVAQSSDGASAGA